jgi:hypothetical protein
VFGRGVYHAINNIGRKHEVVSTRSVCQRDVQFALSNRLAYARYNRDLQVAENNAFKNFEDGKIAERHFKAAKWDESWGTWDPRALQGLMGKC